MPYSDKHILTDKGGKPIPQVWNPAVGDYEPLPGSAASGMRAVLYDASGNPLVVDDGKLAVRATELEGLLNTLSAKEDALSSLVQQVSDRIGEVSPTPTPNTVADRLRQIASTLSETATENTLATVSTRVQQVIDRLGEISGAPTANTLADRLKQIADRLGEVASSPTANTVLARLKTLEVYLDGLEAALGTQADAEATGNGSIIGILKRLRTILTDVWSNGAIGVKLRSADEAVLHDFTATSVQNVVGNVLYTYGNDVLMRIRPGNVREMLVVPEVSNDGTTWVRTSATNLLTGTTSTTILNPGSFLVHSRGWKMFRANLTIFPTFPTNPAEVKITATPVLPGSVPLPLSKPISRVTKRPAVMQPKNSDVILAESAMIPLWVDEDGTIWGVGKDSSTGRTIMKSSDGGVTKTNVYTFGSGPQILKRMGDNSLVCILGNGHIYRSTDNGATWVQVYDTMTQAGIVITPMLGHRVYNNIFLYAQYSNKTITGDKLRVFLSTDYGQTWQPILTGDGSGTSFHFHDVCYDPYDNCIWVVAGDELAVIYRSYDFGRTWQVFGAGGKQPTQFTQVVPLPNCVLFGTDTPRTVGWWRWERAAHRDLQRETEEEFFSRLEPAWVRFRPSAVGEAPFYAHSYVGYGDNPIVIFGLRQKYDAALEPATIYMTTDGYNFFPIWTSGRLPATGYGVRRIVGVGGGKVVAEVEGISGNANILSFPMPTLVNVSD